MISPGAASCHAHRRQSPFAGASRRSCPARSTGRSFSLHQLCLSWRNCWLVVIGGQTGLWSLVFGLLPPPHDGRGKNSWVVGKLRVCQCCHPTIPSIRLIDLDLGRRETAARSRGQGHGWIWVECAGFHGWLAGCWLLAAGLSSSHTPSDKGRGILSSGCNSPQTPVAVPCGPPDSAGARRQTPALPCRIHTSACG